MKSDQIVEIYEQRIPRHILEFVDALSDKELFYTSTSLEQIYRTERELDMAITRAMRIFSTMGIPLEQHFRRRYISDNAHHTIQCDWKMSKMAYYLTVVNGDPENPLVGRMQWELVKRML